MINHRRTTIASIAIVMLLLILTPPPVMAIENCSVEAWDTTPATPVNQCHYCSSSYSWNPIEKQCQDTTGSNCLTFSPSSISPITTCLRCDCKQALDSTNKCVDSPIANCEQISVVAGATTTCSLCRNGDLYGYGKEDFGLKSDKSACIDNTGKTPNCQIYSLTDICTECHSGYVLFTVTADQSKRCVIASSTISNCLAGNITGTEPNLTYSCTTCPLGFKKDSLGKGCYNTMIPGCKVSDFSDNCSGASASCEDGWILNTSTNTCQKSCNSQDGLVQSLDKLSCVKAADASCSNANQAGDCTCSSGQFLSFNKKKCVSAPSNCIRQGPQGLNSCAECETGYQLVVNDNWSSWICQSNGSAQRVANCYAAYPSQTGTVTDIWHCRMCNPGYILGDDYACYAKMTGCPWWAQKSDQYCEWCSKGYYKLKNKCVALPPTIDPWCDSFDDSSTCANNCKDGFEWNELNKMCQRILGAGIIDNCDHYMQADASILTAVDATKCMHCADGYEVDPAGQYCSKQIMGCEAYDVNGNCTKCSFLMGYALKGNSCVQTPSYGCTLIDSTTDNCLSCIHERQNGIDYDYSLDANGVCVSNKMQSKILHCKTYNVNNSCSACYEPYTISGEICSNSSLDNCAIKDANTFTCLSQPIANCETSPKSDLGGKCKECLSNFKLVGYDTVSQTGTSCTADDTIPKIPNCTAYDTGQKCIKCKNNYVLSGLISATSSGTDCILSTQVNDGIQTAYTIGKRNGCTIYSSSTGICTECDSTKFALDLTNASTATPCKSNTGTNCLVFNGTSCTKCLPTFTINAAQNACEKPLGVQEGDENQRQKHRKCSTGYVLKLDSGSTTLGTCIQKGAVDTVIDNVYKTITKCVQYDGTKDTFRRCLKCDTGFIPSANQDSCITIDILNCETQDPNDLSKCIKCQLNFALSDWTLGTNNGINCVATTIGDCDAVDTIPSPVVCKQCGNNKTLDATGANCVTITDCLTHIGHQNNQCLACNIAGPPAQPTLVLIGSVNVAKPEDGGDSCYDSTLTTNTDFETVRSKYTPLPSNCIAYDTLDTKVCVQCASGFYLMPGTQIGNEANNICGTIANCNIYVDPGVKIGACYECASNYYLVNGYVSSDHNKGALLCQNSSTGSPHADLTAALSAGKYNGSANLPAQCKAFDSNGNCVACLPTFQLDTSTPPQCVAIANCMTAVTDKNVNLNGRCLICNTGFALNKSYDKSKPQNGAESCVTDTSGCTAQDPNVSNNCVKCDPAKFLDITKSPHTCIPSPTGCAIADVSDSTYKQCARCIITSHLLRGDICIDVSSTTDQSPLRPAQCGVYDNSGKCVWCSSIVDSTGVVNSSFINENSTENSINPGCKDVSSTLSGCAWTMVEGTTNKCGSCTKDQVLLGVSSPTQPITPSSLGTSCGTAPSVQENCMAFDTNNACTKCASTYGVTPNPVSCFRASNCASADPADGTKCNTCNPGFILKLDPGSSTKGICIDRTAADSVYDSQYPFMIENCAGYLPTSNLCGMCIPGYKLDGNTLLPQCIQDSSIVPIVTAANCITQVANDPTKCSVCKNPFKLDATGTCRVNSVNNCVLYDTSVSTCFQCVDGYNRDGSKSCVACTTNQSFDSTTLLCNAANPQIANCATSGDGFSSCTTCLKDYLPSFKTDLCVSVPTVIPNCVRVNSDDATTKGTKCVWCADNYALKSDMSGCTLIVNGCKTYDSDGACTECYLPKYYLHTDSVTQKTTCKVAVVPFCVENVEKTATTQASCTKCYDGFGLKTWTDGGMTNYACVYNKLSCAKDRCISYESFTDWSLSTCTNLAPQPIKPINNATNTNSTVTPKPNTNDSLNTILINTVALVAIVVSVSVLL